MIKRWTLPWLLLGAVGATVAPEPSSAAEDTRGFWRLQPASALLSPDFEGWYVQRQGERATRETLSGETSYTPTAELGISGRAPGFWLELSVGGGALLNDAFDAVLARADVALRFDLADGISLAPRAGYIQLSPDTWKGDNDVRLDSASGYSAGLDVTLGGKALFAQLTAEYLGGLTVEASAADNANLEFSEPEIDLSGYQLMLGVGGYF